MVEPLALRVLDEGVAGRRLGRGLEPRLWGKTDRKDFSKRACLGKARWWWDGGVRATHCIWAGRGQLIKRTLLTPLGRVG